MQFFVGLHQPHTARHFERCMISVNVLRYRRADFDVGGWMLDSGAFTQIAKHGMYIMTVEEHAVLIHRWKRCGRLVAAVAQDYMCEPFVLSKTGLTVADHQRLTIERYDALRALVEDVHIMPVLQGYEPSAYVDHIRQYGERLTHGMWVGVGSVCKRNADMGAIERVLHAIKTERPDLRIHAFGLKETALRSSYVRDAIHTADSMAWSFAERKKEQARVRQGLPKLGPSRANDWRAAAEWIERIETQTVTHRPLIQLGLW